MLFIYKMWTPLNFRNNSWVNKKKKLRRILFQCQHLQLEEIQSQLVQLQSQRQKVKKIKRKKIKVNKNQKLMIKFHKNQIKLKKPKKQFNKLNLFSL